MSSNKESSVLPGGNEGEDERSETNKQISSAAVSRKPVPGEGKIQEKDIRSRGVAITSSKTVGDPTRQKKPTENTDGSEGECSTNQTKNLYGVKIHKRLEDDERAHGANFDDASIQDQSAHADQLSVDEVASAKSDSPFVVLPDSNPMARKTTCEETMKEHAPETCLHTSELILSSDDREEKLDDRETVLLQEENPLVTKKDAILEKEQSDNNYCEDGADEEIAPSGQGNTFEGEVARDLRRVKEEIDHGHVFEQISCRLKFGELLKIWNASGRAIVLSRMMMKFWIEEALSATENNGNTRTKEPVDGISDTSSDTTEKRSADPLKGHRSDHHPNPEKILLSMMNQFVNSTEVNVYNASISLLVFRPANGDNDDNNANDDEGLEGVMQLEHPTSDLVVNEPPEPPQHEPVDPGNMGLVLPPDIIMEPVPFGMPEVCVGCGAEIALEHDCPMRQNRAFVDEDPMAQDNGRGF